MMSSSVTTAATGRENQLIRAVYPRWSFVLSYGGGNSWLREQTQNITIDPRRAGFIELEQISGLFLACLGPYGEFYYSDPDDNSRNNQFVANGNGSSVSFPLMVSWGSGPFTPSFTSPVSGIQSLTAVYLNGTLQSVATYAMDATNTRLVFTSPPGSGVVITASFVFYFRCRFLDDKIEFSQWAKNLWDTKEVRFESVKP